MTQTDTAVAPDPQVSEGKLFATLSYVMPFFLLVPLINRKNGFALFHAKQALTLWIAAVAVNIVLTVIGFVLPAMISMVVSLMFSLACLGMMVFGAWTAWSERRQPLPLIGKYGEKYLAGVK
jgi:uncharacterized membrane protein